MVSISAEFNDWGGGVVVGLIATAPSLPASGEIKVTFISYNMQ